MALKELIQRSYSCEVRALDDGSGAIIAGRPIVFNSRTDLGWFDEVIVSGALDKTDLTDVRLLVNHDLNRIPLARSRRNNGNNTLQLTPIPEGMEFEANIDIDNNASARELYSAVNRGDITGMSFMFSIEREEWDNLDTDHPLRRILDIGSIVEISAVTFPAYNATEIYARDAKDALEKARAALEKARKRNAEQPVDTGLLEALKARLELIC